MPKASPLQGKCNEESLGNYQMNSMIEYNDYWRERYF